MNHLIPVPDKKRPDKIDPGKGPTPSEEIPDLLSSFEQEVNTSEGSEFLDDALRMEDQPLGETNTKEKE